MTGFLCVERPRHNGDDEGLLTALLPIMIMERGRRTFTFNGDIDALTGLKDPTSFQGALGSLNSEALSSMGVMHIDINGLHAVNRDRGYECGNELLIFASRTLSMAFESASVYRATGHSFAVLCPDVTHAAFLSKCTQAQAALDQQYPARYSVGYTWSEKDYAVRQLAEHAESIMNYNKQAYCRSAERNGERDVDEALRELQTAIRQGRYTVYLQPKNDLSTGKVVGCEALARYIDPERGIVPPVEFVHRMEERHVIRELDLYVFEQSAQILSLWKAGGLRLLPISVNFSRQTLLDRSTLAATLAILEQYGIPTDYVEIEITETIATIERQTIAHAVAAFRERGFRFSLDDFGSEYSSISMLSEIAFDVIKLDKSIINHYATNRVSRSIVECMIHICRVMGAVCIAEGVETQEQADALRAAGCDCAQGYYYNKPLPTYDFEQRYLVGESKEDSHIV